MSEAPAARSETEFGVRFETGEIVFRTSRERALGTVRATRARGGAAVLVTRTITVTPWSEEEPSDADA